MNSLHKYLHHKFSSSKEHWFPFLSVYYLTYSCNFRCPFCSDGSGKPYYELPNRILPADEVLRLLKIIRSKCDYVVITGGEPLSYPEFSTIIERVRLLKFREVILTTNGYEVEKYLPAIAQSVTSLVFSLNSLNSLKADKLFGKGSGILKKILDNIELAHLHKKKRYQIHISSVVTPGNIADLYDVYYFSKERGFIFAACPQLVGVKAHVSLINNNAYRDFYNFLIAEKKKGNKVFGTVKYLENMRDLSKFNCYPFTMLVVSPSGGVYYPCLEIGHLAGNLLENPDLSDIRRNGLHQFGPQPACDNRCHSACALGFSTILEHPSAILSEASLQLKGQMKYFLGI